MKNNAKTTKKHILNHLKKFEGYDKRKINCEELFNIFELKFIISFDLSNLDLSSLMTFCSLNRFLIQFTDNSFQITAYIN